MDWIRDNKPLAAIIGVFLAISAGLGYMAFDAWTRFTTSKETYQSLGAQIAGLQSARLAPTEENVKKKQADVEAYAATVNKLGGALLILQQPLKPVKDIEFQTNLKAKIADARKKAKIYKMGLPPEFAFGFDEYTKSLPKSAEAAAELALYLDAMNELLNLFMKSGVSSVDLFERSTLPVESAQAPVGGIRPGMNRAPVPASITSSRQASVILTVDQGALQLVISRLANPSDMPFFSSVRLVRIENQRSEGPLRSEVMLPESAPDIEGSGAGGAVVGATTAGTAAAANEIKPPDPAAPDSVPVIGEEKLKVRLDIDFLRFDEAAKGVVMAPGR
ncbi:MAG: Amuc_1100 family pilus-like protein [Prosthecobacter sp.]